VQPGLCRFLLAFELVYVSVFFQRQTNIVETFKQAVASTWVDSKRHYGAAGRRDF
jgi:hypothetical protein